MARRDRPSSAPFPAAVLRDLLGAQGGAWVLLGVVQARAQGDAAFEIEDGDVRVDCLLSNGVHCWARLGAIAAGPAVGVWSIPPEGAEVVVALVEGTPEGEGVIVATLSTGQLPDGLASPGDIYIVPKAGAKVFVHDGHAGDAKALATKQDVDDHVHRVPAMVVVTTAAAGTWSVQLAAGSPVDPIDTAKPAAIAGTQVLRAK